MGALVEARVANDTGSVISITEKPMNGMKEIDPGNVMPAANTTTVTGRVASS